MIAFILIITRVSRIIILTLTQIGILSLIMITNMIISQ